MGRRRRRRVEHGDAARLRHPLGEPRARGRRRRRRRRWAAAAPRPRAGTLAVLGAGRRRRQLALGLERVDAGLIAGELRVGLHRVGDHVVDLFLLVLGHAPKGDPERVVALKLPQALASRERHQDLFFTISAACGGLLADRITRRETLHRRAVRRQLLQRRRVGRAPDLRRAPSPPSSAPAARASRAPAPAPGAPAGRSSRSA